MRFRKANSPSSIPGDLRRVKFVSDCSAQLNVIFKRSPLSVDTCKHWSREVYVLARFPEISKSVQAWILFRIIHRCSRSDIWLWSLEVYIFTSNPRVSRWVEGAKIFQCDFFAHLEILARILSGACDTCLCNCLQGLEVGQEC